MLIPDRSTFRRLSRRGNLIPVALELPADVETPVSAFLKIAESSPYAFLLESVEGGEQTGRYSFLGADPTEVVAIRGGVVEHRTGDRVRILPHAGDPLAPLRGLLRRFRPVHMPGLPRFHGGAVGYLAYDLVRHFERLPSNNPDDLGLPEACLIFTENLLVFDHVKHVIKVVSHAHVTGDPDRAYDRAQTAIRRLAARLARPRRSEAAPRTGPVRLRSNLTREQFLRNVRRAKEYIRAGDIIQVQLSQRLSGTAPAKPFDVYRALRSVNPSPYMYYLRFPDCELIGSSPELLVRREGSAVATRPIAGTVPRGDTPEADARQAAKLLADPKERAEHIMLVDLGRNDLGRVCRYGSVTVPELMVIERYSHVMHIVSHVQGTLAPGHDQFDVLRAAFPAGTVTGAPKIRAMEIIEELETTRRGPYAGAVGYFDFSGNLDTAIIIRTLLYAGGRYHLQAAAGIVADSVPAREYQETLNKLRALVAALELASTGWTAGGRQKSRQPQRTRRGIRGRAGNKS
jgi:anthranilate synthase component I